MIKPNGEISPPLKCPTCPINVGCCWNCLRGDDLAEIYELRAALRALVEAKALQGVREIVAGWNGEGREDGPYPRHSDKLGATLPKTNCGAVYALDEALQAGRVLLSMDSHR